VRLSAQRTVVILAAALVLVIAGGAPLFAEPPEKPAKAKAPPTPAPAQPQQPESGKSQFAPVVEAQKLDVKTCLPMLSDLSRLSILGAHTSVTGLNREAPNERMFTALSFSSPLNAAAGPSVSVINATPTVKGHCDGANIRVDSSKQSCEDVARELQKQNAPKPETVNGTLVYQTNAAGQRLLLLPAAGSGCVVVSTGGYYGR
jgi:hypothetical protein